MIRASCCKAEPKMRRGKKDPTERQELLLACCWVLLCQGLGLTGVKWGGRCRIVDRRFG
jgi:hypothetical protein